MNIKTKQERLNDVKLELQIFADDNAKRILSSSEYKRRAKLRKQKDELEQQIVIEGAMSGAYKVER